MEEIWLQKIWLLSDDGQVSSKLDFDDADAMLPNFRTTLETMLPNHVKTPNAVQISIMLEHTRGYVLNMVVEYIVRLNRLFEDPGEVTAWRREYFAKISDELLNDVLQDVQKRNMAAGESIPPLMWLLERSLKFEREKRRPPLTWKEKLADLWRMMTSRQ